MPYVLTTNLPSTMPGIYMYYPPPKSYHSANCCKVPFSLNPIEARMPIKRTAREQVFLTERLVYLCNLSKDNAFFLILKTSSIWLLMYLKYPQFDIFSLNS